MRCRGYVRTLSMTVAVASCNQADSPSSVSVIVGKNDLSYYLDDDVIARATGHMHRGCTVTHMGNGFVLTAGHCLSEDSCEGEDYHVTWSYRETKQLDPMVSPCESVVARSYRGHLDYAILRYGTHPDEYLPLNLEEKPRLGEPLTLYSHPEGSPLSWSGWCEHDGEHSDVLFTYSCDTLSGSSGAAVLNEDLEIVGVHSSGSEALKANAGTYIMEIAEIFTLDLGTE